MRLPHWMLARCTLVQVFSSALVARRAMQDRYHLTHRTMMSSRKCRPRNRGGRLSPIHFTLPDEFHRALRHCRRHHDRIGDLCDTSNGSLCYGWASGHVGLVDRYVNRPRRRLVWAELGAAMPAAGTYVYLQEAFGPARSGRLFSFYSSGAQHS